MTNWFKIARADRDRIIDRCGEKSPGVLAIWVALSDLANRHRTSRFQSSGAEIGRIAGVSRRTVERLIPILRDLGLVQWTRTTNPETGGLEANNYHLPTFDPADNVSEPLPTECRNPTDKDLASPCRSYIRKTEKTERRTKGVTPTERITLEKQLEKARRQLSELNRAGLRERAESTYQSRKVGLEAEVGRLEAVLHV